MKIHASFVLILVFLASLAPTYAKGGGHGHSSHVAHSTITHAHAPSHRTSLVTHRAPKPKRNTPGAHMLATFHQPGRK